MIKANFPFTFTILAKSLKKSNLPTGALAQQVGVKK